MQMITRQVNEGVVIGDDIHVTVLEIREESVRLGISSPHEIPSYREETLYWEPAEHLEALQVQ
jgi:carbon storage regulator